MRDAVASKPPWSAASAFLCIGVTATLFWKPPILLVWNASPSVPVGFYDVVPGAKVARGDWVIAFAPGSFRRLADRRGYIPAKVPLVKRVAGGSGDRVCGSGRNLSINGRVAAVRLERDLKGRILPRWEGCHTLRSGEVLLLGNDRRSFDGRYFGPTRRDEVIGKALRL